MGFGIGWSCDEGVCYGGGSGIGYWGVVGVLLVCMFYCGGFVLP